MLVVMLAWSLSCVPVQKARAEGYTDQQIEVYARDTLHLPAWAIRWGRNHCPLTASAAAR